MDKKNDHFLKQQKHKIKLTYIRPQDKGLLSRAKKNKKQLLNAK